MTEEKYVVFIANESEYPLVKDVVDDQKKIVITGEGAINAIKAALLIPEDYLIINIGYCGSDNFEVGKWITPLLATIYQKKVSTNQAPLPLKVKNQIKKLSFYNDKPIICYSSTDFIEKPLDDDAAIYDMELAFIRSVHPNTIAFKKVSDNLSHNEYRKAAK